MESDHIHRHRLEWACRAEGLNVRSTTSVTQSEQWPADEVVITDFEHLSFVFRDAGAAEVVALVRDAVEGARALEQGATRCCAIAVPVNRLASWVRFYCEKQPDVRDRLTA